MDPIGYVYSFFGFLFLVFGANHFEQLPLYMTWLLKWRCHGDWVRGFFSTRSTIKMYLTTMTLPSSSWTRLRFFEKKTHLKRRFCQGRRKLLATENYSRHFCQSRQEKADDIQHDSLIHNNHGLRSLQWCLLLAIQLGMFIDITIFKGTIHHHYLLRPWPRRPNLLIQAILVVARSNGSFEVRIRCCRNVVNGVYKDWLRTYSSPLHKYIYI